MCELSKDAPAIGKSEESVFPIMYKLLSASTTRLCGVSSSEPPKKEEANKVVPSAENTDTEISKGYEPKPT